MNRDLPSLPSSQQYREALSRLAEALPSNHLALLRAHYRAPDHTATATDLAKAVGYQDYRGVNAQYGRLGTILREALNYEEGGQESYIIASFIPPGVNDNIDWLWVMHPELAEALEQLGWVKDAERDEE
ncbi:MAG TPA: hypothetical protein VN688_23115 [Gemmataceae bacterium]|nr:hypothetical protein [Gemmataceae bacterium]